ncbi:FluC/FEX family fluoride channel [Synechococcus sp. BS55D]|uniref:FluC/FEX family fluoride channel n=1 Tax=Synechococcus sp. BS55D TaxID=2055943 RepID=UPI00103C11D3|nr:CrcB family protein [Synechococcus sp. BS55D]TCD58151.1 chromosome condensation protein CrcB [Synechococcus sp. BS55D]
MADLKASKGQLTLRAELEELLLVAVGAVPGALIRWQVGVHLHDKDVLVNVLGALILGWLAGQPIQARRQLLVGIGFCGSLTTFSSWMVNSVGLLAAGDWASALGLIGLTLGLGLGAAALGFALGRALKGSAPSD